MGHLGWLWLEARQTWAELSPLFCLCCATPGSLGCSGKGLGVPAEGSDPKTELWSVLSTIDILDHLEDTERGKDK